MFCGQCIIFILQIYKYYSSTRDMLGETRIKRQTASFARIFLLLLLFYFEIQFTNFNVKK